MADIENMLVNGYAYPTISPQVLDWWLPRIDWVSDFSYGFNAAGELINLEDQNIIAEASAAGVREMMVLAPLNEEGSFDGTIAAAMFEDPVAVNRLIDNIEANIKEKGMGGIDFDIEFLPADYADDYVELVRRTRERLAPQGYLTTVALAPKISADQPGLLYQGHDYAAMGQVADYSLIMTYEWGYTYGPPLPVSPINNVRQVIEYAISEIPPAKVLMGMNNYGYDWTLPFIKGESKAEKLSNYQAAARAEYYGVPVQWDEEAMAPYFTYVAPDGAEHIVWFENEESWQARLEMVEEYNLAGVGIWTIMDIFYGGI